MGNFIVAVVVFLGLLTLGYVAGSHFEHQHYQSLKLRERKTHRILLSTLGAKQPLPEAKTAKLFVGSVVISADYFKIVAASLRTLIGGRVVAYESLLDRGRREALLRMKEQAIDWGATQIVNVRLETADIGRSTGDNNGLVAIEVIAYGTGIR